MSSLLSDAWKALTTVATVVPQLEANTKLIKEQADSLHNVRERLAAVEALIGAARERTMVYVQQLPPR